LSTEQREIVMSTTTRQVFRVLTVALATLGLHLFTPSAGNAASASDDDSLASYFGATTSPADQQARFERQERKRQEGVAVCMRKAGFKYVPFMPQMNFNRPNGPEPGKEDDWQRKNGYGMANSMETMQAPQQMPKNPNDDITKGFSPSELKAYQKALYGSPPKPGETTYMPTDGCMNEGFAAQQKIYQTLGPKFDELAKRIDSDKRVLEMMRKWSACMKTKGFSVQKQQDIFEKVLMPLQQGIFPSGPGPGEVTKATVVNGPPKPDKAKLAELRKVELRVANADLDCLSKKDRKERDTIRKEYERAFIAANKADLEKLKAANG
jgi:hypothetical protein